MLYYFLMITSLSKKAIDKWSFNRYLEWIYRAIK